MRNNTIINKIIKEEKLMEAARLVNASRISYYASASFWVCEATEENYKILRQHNVQFSTNTFLAANGIRVSRYEFN